MSTINELIINLRSVDAEDRVFVERLKGQIIAFLKETKDIEYIDFLRLEGNIIQRFPEFLREAELMKYFQAHFEKIEQESKPSNRTITRRDLEFIRFASPKRVKIPSNSTY